MPDPRMAGQAPAPQGQMQQGGGQQDIMQQAQMEIAQMPRPELEKLAMQLIMEVQGRQQAGGQAQPQGQQQMR